MNTWILIIIQTYIYQSSTGTASFVNEAACRKAAAEIVRVYEETHSGTISATCTPAYVKE